MLCRAALGIQRESEVRVQYDAWQTVGILPWSAMSACHFLSPFSSGTDAPTLHETAPFHALTCLLAFAQKYVCIWLDSKSWIWVYEFQYCFEYHRYLPFPRGNIGSVYPFHFHVEILGSVYQSSPRYTHRPTRIWTGGSRQRTGQCTSRIHIVTILRLLIYEHGISFRFLKGLLWVLSIMFCFFCVNVLHFFP